MDQFHRNGSEASYNLSFSEWHHHPITPPSEQHMPELFDGTTHLVEKHKQKQNAFLRIQQSSSNSILVVDPLLNAISSQPRPTPQSNRSHS
jgi:hypothetical protein